MSSNAAGNKTGQGCTNPGRRKFAQLALAGTLGGAVSLSRPNRVEAQPMLHDLPSGIKIALQLGRDPGDEELQFANQLGVEYVTIWLHAELATYHNFVRLRQKVEVPA